IFCYPNGTAEDYSPKVIDAVRDAGLIAAVTTEPAHLTRLSAAPSAPYRLPRFWCPKDLPHLAQIVSGVEGAKLRLWQALRG
ncbi:MAG TPA: hypothetical protein VHU40_12340, partial [Polyangia bacterium]|nr:hypothetical protein [Polyangia bacterium]